LKIQEVNINICVCTSVYEGSELYRFGGDVAA